MFRAMEPTTHKRLSAEERDHIAIWHAEGRSERDIASELGRSPSTISREIRRNSTPGGARPASYRSQAAHVLAGERRKRPRERLKNAWLREYVSAKMKEGWSPERIAGRLAREHPDCYERNLCPEAIYLYIWSDEAPRELRSLLARRRLARGKADGRGRRKLKIIGRVGIEERPAEVEDRRQAGHWEGDSVIGRRGGAILHTEVERTTRLLQARLLPVTSSQGTLQAQRDIFGSVPAELRRTVTSDNGCEFAAHQGLHDLGMQTYFARPHHAWERGSNENANGLIRRWLPKKTSFDGLRQSDIDVIVDRINDLPRKCHNFASANEEWARLTEKAGVALAG